MAKVTERLPQRYNDWPNSQGFDVRYEERSPVELEIVGTIPEYAAGILFRNGLGPREVPTEKNTTYRVNHWFDCLSQVHRFQIHPPTAEHPKVRVTHNSRLTCDGLVERIQKTGDREGYTFAAKYDPCLSFFQKLQSFFRPGPSEGPRDVDVSVTLSTNFPGLSPTGEPQKQGYDPTTISTLVNKTDNSLMQSLHPETLEPLGIARQDKLHPLLKGPISAAHAKTCPVTGDVFNYNLDFGRLGSYRVFRVSAATGETSILATVNQTAAYVHSMFLTENYVILCVWNSYFTAGGMSLLWKKNYLDSLGQWDGSRPSTWYVIDRTPVEQGGKGLIATYESDPFFAFHTINAYEEPSAGDPSQTDIVADICIYDNLDVLHRFYIENLMSDSPLAKPYCDPSNTSGRAYFQRFKLPSVPQEPATEPQKAVTVFSDKRGIAPELPSLNNARRCKKHRYVYGVTDTGKSTFFDGLIKYDTETRTNVQWSVFGQSAGEPIFVADPNAEDEDAGVLLSVVLDGTKGKSYLMVLDAKDMTEMGRANVDGVVGFGFHGTHVPARVPGRKRVNL